MRDSKMIPCPKCGDDFPELRKTMYNYHVCVKERGYTKSYKNDSV